MTTRLPDLSAHIHDPSERAALTSALGALLHAGPKSPPCAFIADGSTVRRVEVKAASGGPGLTPAMAPRARVAPLLMSAVAREMTSSARCCTASRISPLEILLTSQPMKGPAKQWRVDLDAKNRVQTITPVTPPSSRTMTRGTVHRFARIGG